MAPQLISQRCMLIPLAAFLLAAAQLSYADNKMDVVLKYVPHHQQNKPVHQMDVEVSQNQSLITQFEGIGVATGYTLTLYGVFKDELPSDISIKKSTPPYSDFLQGQHGVTVTDPSPVAVATPLTATDGRPLLGGSKTHISTAKFQDKGVYYIVYAFFRPFEISGAQFSVVKANVV